MLDGKTALIARWAHRDDFVVLDLGFGKGKNFLDTWAAWQGDPARCERLVYIALGVDPDAAQVQIEQSAVSDLSGRLFSQWPTTTPGLHTLSLDQGPASGVTLLLGFGDVATLLPQLVAWVDAFDLTGLPPMPTASGKDRRWLARLPRIARTACLALARRDDAVMVVGLQQCGFKPDPNPPGNPEEPHVGTATLSFQPHHTAQVPAGGLWPPSSAAAKDRHAVIIGAGLAGCAAARGLARQGWRTTLIDSLPAPAQAASGNPGGLFHSIVHGEDGIHARAHRAAALRTAAVVSAGLQRQRFAGQCEGLLRLDASHDEASANELAQRLGLPQDHVEWRDRRAARSACGLDVPTGGWFFHQGGWLDPSGYAQSLLEDARRSADVVFLGNRHVQRLSRKLDGGSTAWQALDEHGHVIVEAPVVVLAGAAGTAALIDTLPEAASLPMSAVRGQLSGLLLQEGMVAPLRPVAGAGYALPAHRDRLWFGATSQVNDLDPSVRDEDHGQNLAQAASLGCQPWPEGTAPLPASIQGRVAWRATTPDRLPYIGALPLRQFEPAAHDGTARKKMRWDQPRFVPRLRDEHGGVHVLTGLGSRGITWAVLAGEVLASWVTGSPCPIEGPLRDALDPARVVSRSVARRTPGSG